MHRDDTSPFLLYIEPKKEEKLLEPINDEYTYLIQLAYSLSTKKGHANYSELNTNANITLNESGGWMGIHETDCGKWSDSHDFLLENNMIVNSLCVYYMEYYRNSIPENDWNKIYQLKEFYSKKTYIPDHPKLHILKNITFKNKIIPIKIEIDLADYYGVNLDDYFNKENEIKYIGKNINCLIPENI